MQLSFFSDGLNIFFTILIIVLLLVPFFLIEYKDKVIAKFFSFFMVWSSTFIIGMLVYLVNFVSESPTFKDDITTLSTLSVDVNTFKKYENKLPREKDFYLSSFLNHSEYFLIKDGEKIFNPIQKSDFKIIDNEKSLSFSYTNDYDQTSFGKTGQAYRSCLAFTKNLRKHDSFKDIKVAVNGHDFDYKKVTPEFMKDICYSDKPNHYLITFF